MPTFKATFLRPGFQVKKSGGTGGLSSTMANSELTILKNKLSKDGFLNRADYEQLTEKAKELRTKFNAGTKAGQNAIATIDAEISNFDLQMEKLTSQRSSVKSITTDFDDQLKTSELQFSSNPIKFLEEKNKIYKQGIENLANGYEQATEAGNFTEAHDYLSEHDKRENELNEIKSIQTAIRQSKGERLSNVGAFIKTDSQGNVTNIKYGQITSTNASGFVQTNAFVSNMPVYLMPNRRSGKVNSSVLAGREFSDASGDFFLDAITGETLNRLTTGEAGGEIDLTPNDLKIRSHIPDGTWARGRDALYKNEGNNQYIKYPNTDPAELGLKDSQIQDVNRIWENRINENTVAQGNTDAAKNAFKHVPAGPMSTVPQQDLIPQEPAPIQGSTRGSSQPKGGTSPENFASRAKGIFTGLFSKFSKPESSTDVVTTEPQFDDFIQ